MAAMVSPDASKGLLIARPGGGRGGGRLGEEESAGATWTKGEGCNGEEATVLRP